MDDKKYIDSIHRLGRWGTVLATALVLGIPAIVCAYYDCFPALATIIQPTVVILTMMGPATCSEVFSYGPILGSASYISFITGNVVNLKLPAAISAQAIAEVEPNTPVSDAVSTMAIALSSIMTMAIIVVGVLLFVPLQPLLTAPAFQTATSYIMPALVGGMLMTVFGQGSGKMVIDKKLLITVLPLILVILGNLLIPKFTSYQGYTIIVMIFVTIGWAYLLYKKGIVKMVPREEKK